jgi:hypothetical protein
MVSTADIYVARVIKDGLGFGETLLALAYTSVGGLSTSTIRNDIGKNLLLVPERLRRNSIVGNDIILQCGIEDDTGG